MKLLNLNHMLFDLQVRAQTLGISGKTESQNFHFIYLFICYPIMLMLVCLLNKSLALCIGFSRNTLLITFASMSY